MTGGVERNLNKELTMQESMERWLNYWVAKPTSWTIFGLWTAVKYTWFGIVWLAIWLHEQWTAWRSKSETPADPVLTTEPQILAPTKRSTKRQAA